MVVYADVIFMTNFVIDAAVLTSTAWTRKLRVKKWRVALSAAVGSSYVLMMFVPALSPLYTVFVKFLISVLMIYAAFGFVSLQYFIRNLAVFYLVNFVAAGGIFALRYLLLSSSDVMNGILFFRTGGAFGPVSFSLVFVLVVFFAVIYFFRGVFISARKRDQLTRFLADLEVTILGQSRSCTGLVDTGNHLVDPLTRTPVLVMEAGLWKDHLPEKWTKMLKASQVEQILMDDDNQDHPWRELFRIVPFRGVNQGMKFMLAVKPEKVVIRQSDQVMEVRKVLIGLDAGELSSDGSYRAIIHPQLMESD